MGAHVSWGGKLRPGVNETNVNDGNEWEYQRRLREDVMGGIGIFKRRKKRENSAIRQR